jgi:hypothetical protein
MEVLIVVISVLTGALISNWHPIRNLSEHVIFSARRASMKLEEEKPPMDTPKINGQSSNAKVG